jgi:glycosyltransferase involved in cell wall biosynthesis
MRVLLITARFPPYHQGGYEIRGKDIADGLSSRGHKLLVITSGKPAGSSPSASVADYAILRRLHLRTRTRSFIDRLTEKRGTHLIGMLLIFARELILDLIELRFIDREIERFQPDVIYLGHIGCLTRSLVPHLADRPEPIVWDEGGTGLVDCWTEKNIWYKLTDEHVGRHRVVASLKSFVVGAACRLSGGRLKPRFAWPSRMHVFFNDALGLRNAVARKVPVDGAKIIHSGVDTDRFVFRPRTGLGSTVRFLVPGRIEPRKGQLDGVRLLAELSKRSIDARMVFVGAVWSDSYYRELTREFGGLRLEDKVRLLPMVPQNELAALYREADICLFPSYFRTGFSRVPLEAMASGCIIISYGNEGSDEIIRHRQNGFLVEPGDSSGIASIIAELAAEPELVRYVTSGARSEIEEKHSLQAYVGQVEEILVDATGGRRR